MFQEQGHNEQCPMMVVACNFLQVGCHFVVGKNSCQEDKGVSSMIRFYQ